MMIVFGLMLEFPVVLIGLSRLGILTHAGWRAAALGDPGHRAFAVLLTPGGDPFSMVILARLMFLLFEGSLLIIRLIRALDRCLVPASARVLLLTDPAMAAHVAPGHAERPERVEAVAMGVADGARSRRSRARAPRGEPADDLALRRIHPPWYLEAAGCGRGARRRLG